MKLVECHACKQIFIFDEKSLVACFGLKCPECEQWFPNYKEHLLKIYLPFNK